jgi:hypothetical protein
MPDRARQAVNFRDHQGIPFARKLDCRFKLLTRCDRADVLAEQFLGSRRFQIPDLRFKTGDLLNGRRPGIAIIIMAYLGYVRKRAMMYYVMR